MKKKNKNQEVTNLYHIQICKICASCAHKTVNERGKRFCEKLKKVVGQQDVCSQWEMSASLHKAGIGGGVVRLKGTREIIIR